MGLWFHTAGGGCPMGVVRFKLRRAIALLTSSLVILMSFGSFSWALDHERGVVLVLSGGGTRGFAHVGVLKVLEERQVPVVGIVGTSMGAIIGGLYACGYSAAELEALISNNNILDLLYDRTSGPLPDAALNRLPKARSGFLDFYFDRQHNRIGPMGGMSASGLVSFLNRTISAKVREGDFSKLPIPFAAVATDLETGEPVVLRSGNLADAMRASMAIPGLFEPWMVDGRILVDGGLVANLPVGIAKELFPGFPVVAVNLSERGRKDRKDIRTLYDVVAQSINIITAPSIAAEAAKADILIGPDVSRFGLLDPGGYGAIVESGARAARAALDSRPLRDEGLRHAKKETREDRAPLVKRVIIEGLPDSMAQDLMGRFSSWIGSPVDMNAVSDAAEELMRRDEFLAVNGYAKEEDGGVAVVMSFQRRPPVEVSVGGYATNLHSQRWVSLSAVKRDLASPGDVGELQLRVGDHWGGVLRYFSPYDGNSQWGLAFTGREEEISPEGLEASRWERYGLRVLRYFDNGRTRIGAGVMAERIEMDGSSSSFGPYLYFSYDNTDSRNFPTNGYAVESNLWAPDLERVLSRTVFQRYVPWKDKWRVVLSGGIETGDGDDPPHRAYLGDQEELYSLGDRPLWGDQAAWFRFAVSGTVMQTWWGRVNAEFFGTAGMVMRDWSRRDDSWEVGLALSIPGQFFNGRFITVYNKDGRVTFGFSIGEPIWWNGPLP
ncbi:MAG: patatin-like phospholipase family protein [Thermanaerothrix sp.]|nr:patatin-like phospholipase family protein [Thermanaerothrix sp.]